MNHYLDLELSLDDFNNLELLRKGLYRVSLSVHCMGRIGLPISCHSSPSTLTSTSRVTFCSGSDHGSEKGYIEGSAYYSRAVQCRYVDECFELKESVYFRIALPSSTLPPPSALASKAFASLPTIKVTVHLLRADFGVPPPPSSKAPAGGSAAAPPDEAVEQERKRLGAFEIVSSRTLSIPLGSSTKSIVGGLEATRDSFSSLAQAKATTATSNAADGGSGSEAASPLLLSDAMAASSPWNISSKAALLHKAGETSAQRALLHHSRGVCGPPLGFTAAYVPVIFDTMYLASVGISVHAFHSSSRFKAVNREEGARKTASSAAVMENGQARGGASSSNSSSSLSSSSSSSSAAAAAAPTPAPISGGFGGWMTSLASTLLAVASTGSSSASASSAAESEGTMDWGSPSALLGSSFAEALFPRWRAVRAAEALAVERENALQRRRESMGGGSGGGTGTAEKENSESTYIPSNSGSSYSSGSSSTSMSYSSAPTIDQKATTSKSIPPPPPPPPPPSHNLKIDPPLTADEAHSAHATIISPLVFAAAEFAAYLHSLGDEEGHSSMASPSTPFLRDAAAAIEPASVSLHRFSRKCRRRALVTLSQRRSLLKSLMPGSYQRFDTLLKDEETVGGRRVTEDIFPSFQATAARGAEVNGRKRGESLSHDWFEGLSNALPVYGEDGRAIPGADIVIDALALSPESSLQDSPYRDGYGFDIPSSVQSSSSSSASFIKRLSSPLLAYPERVAEVIASEVSRLADVLSSLHRHLHFAIHSERTRSVLIRLQAAYRSAALADSFHLLPSSIYPVNCLLDPGGSSAMTAPLTRYRSARRGILMPLLAVPPALCNAYEDPSAPELSTARLSHILQPYSPHHLAALSLSEVHAADPVLASTRSVLSVSISRFALPQAETSDSAEFSDAEDEADDDDGRGGVLQQQDLEAAETGSGAAAPASSSSSSASSASLQRGKAARAVTNSSSSSVTNASTAAAAAAAAAAGRVHLVVFLNGLGGGQYDLRLIRSHMKLHHPHLSMFVSTTNQQKQTEGDMVESSIRVATELHEYITTIMVEDGLSLSHLSFVAFSMGGLIARLVLRHPLIAPFLPFCHAFITIASPHLGLLHSSANIVSAGIFLYRQWRQSASLAQMSFQDEATPEGSLHNCLLYLLACGWRADLPRKQATRAGGDSRSSDGAEEEGGEAGGDDGGRMSGAEQTSVSKSGAGPVWARRADATTKEAAVAAGGNSSTSSPSPPKTAVERLRESAFSNGTNGSILARFRHILMLSSEQDSYAPAASCRGEWCEAALKDEKRGASYAEMLRGLFDGIPVERITKWDVHFKNLSSILSGSLSLDGVLGREAHVAFLEAEQVASLLATGLSHIWDPL